MACENKEIALIIIGNSFLKRMSVMEKAQKYFSKNVVRNSLGASGKWRQFVWCNWEAGGYEYHPYGGIWTHMEEFECKIYTKEGTLPSWETEIFTGVGQRMLHVRSNGAGFMASSTSSSSQSEQVSALCLTLSACWWWGCCDVGVKQLWALNISLHVSLCVWAPAYFWESVLPRYSENIRLTFF